MIYVNEIEKLVYQAIEEFIAVSSGRIDKKLYGLYEALLEAEISFKKKTEVNQLSKIACFIPESQAERRFEYRGISPKHRSAEYHAAIHLNTPIKFHEAYEKVFLKKVRGLCNVYKKKFEKIITAS